MINSKLEGFELITLINIILNISSGDSWKSQCFRPWFTHGLCAHLSFPEANLFLGLSYESQWFYFSRHHIRFVAF